MVVDESGGLEAVEGFGGLAAAAAAEETAEE